jgi:hypothetical protein
LIFISEPPVSKSNNALGLLGVESTKRTVLRIATRFSSLKECSQEQGMADPIFVPGALGHVAPPFGNIFDVGWSDGLVPQAARALDAGSCWLALVVCSLRGTGERKLRKHMRCICTLLLLVVEGRGACTLAHWSNDRCRDGLCEKPCANVCRNPANLCEAQHGIAATFGPSGRWTCKKQTCIRAPHASSDKLRQGVGPNRGRPS